MAEGRRCDYLFIRHSNIGTNSQEIPNKLCKKWTSLWVVLCTEISPSFCCISYCKKESDWLLNSKSIVKCPLGDFKVMRAPPGYSKKHENVLQLVFSSYTLSLAFDSMTKMDDWYITLQTVTERHHVDLVRCPEHPEREGEYVIQVCSGSFKVWSPELIPKAQIKWEWYLKQLRRIHWHRNVNKLEVEAGRAAETGEGHFFFTGQHALKLFEAMKVMMTSRAQQMSLGASSGSCPRTPPASSPQVPPRKESATGTTHLASPDTPQLPSPPGIPLPASQRRLFASGQESEESESGEDWTGTGASSDSGISGAGLRRFNPVPPIPYEHSSSRPAAVPPPLPPRDPIVPDVQDDMLNNPYMEINIHTLDCESEYMTMRLRPTYETVEDYGVQQAQQMPSNQDSYLYMVPGNTHHVRNGSVPPTHGHHATPSHRFRAMYDNSSQVNSTGTY